MSKQTREEYNLYCSIRRRLERSRYGWRNYQLKYTVLMRKLSEGLGCENTASAIQSALADECARRKARMADECRKAKDRIRPDYVDVVADMLARDEGERDEK